MNKAEFEEKWLAAFAPNLTKKQYRNCYVWQYLWHVFSYELIPRDKVLSGNAAREAYDKINKDDAIVFHMLGHKQLETFAITEEYKRSQKIESIQELYIVDKKWRWTYVSTHENGWCGPYFYMIEK